MRGLSSIIFGDPGSGKSWLADTAPGPRLIFDAEGGADFTPSGPKIIWDPLTQAVPVADGTWDTCVVVVKQFAQVDQGLRVLESGQHPFESVVIDTLTEVQKRTLFAITGISQPRTQDWGEVLRLLEDVCRRFRDLSHSDAAKTLQTVTLVCQASERGQQAKLRPHVQGQLGDTLPQFTDVVGYLYVTADETGAARRMLMVQPQGTIIAKDRTDKLGSVVVDPNMTTMYTQVFGQLARV